MKPITREWIRKAEGDWAAANVLFRARRNPNYDATCFHAQQCAEKYLKARLEDAGVAVGKTHDLVKLLSLILPTEPAWNVLRQDLIVLTEFAVDYRYPGSSATKARREGRSPTMQYRSPGDSPLVRTEGLKRQGMKGFFFKPGKWKTRTLMQNLKALSVNLS